MLKKQGRSKISAVLVFAMLLSMLMPFSAFGATAQIKDIADSYAQKEIQTLVDEGIISGYEDGSFQPTKAMTRAELAKIIVLSLGLKENADKAASFTDVSKTSWYRGFVGALVESGITQGTTDSTFAPDAKVTREELVVFFVRALKLEDTAKKLAVDAKLSDLKEVSSWAQAHVSLAFKVGFVNGIENKDGSVKFGPKDNAERQALARLAYEFKTNKAKFVDKANELAKTAGVATATISSAAATNNTTVEVTFNQEVSAVDKADFAFDNSLTVSAAALKEGSKTIVVLTTSSQTASTVYKLSYKGKDTGKTVTGVGAVLGGGGSSSSGSYNPNNAITATQILNSGAPYNGNLTINAGGNYGPADGSTTTINGTLTINPGENGEVMLQNIVATNIEVLSGSDQSIKLRKSTISALKVNAPNQTKKVRIFTYEGASVVATNVYSQAILESADGSLGNITLTAAAAGKPIVLKGAIGTVNVEAANADIQLLPASNGGATAVAGLNITAPKASVTLSGTGDFGSVTIAASAADSQLSIADSSNVQSIQVNANVTLSGSPEKIGSIPIQVGPDATVSASDDLKNGLKMVAVDAITAIGSFQEYSVEKEALINAAGVAVSNAISLGVAQADITNYNEFVTAQTDISNFKASVLQILDSEKQSLQVYYYNNESAEAVKSNVWLITRTTLNTNISWSSSDTSVVSIEKGDDNGVVGKVTRPAAGQPDAMVTLTVTIGKNGLTVTKSFSIKVKALSNPTIIDVSPASYNQSITIKGIVDSATDVKIVLTSPDGVETSSQVAVTDGRYFYFTSNSNLATGEWTYKVSAINGTIESAFVTGEIMVQAGTVTTGTVTGYVYGINNVGLSGVTVTAATYGSVVTDATGKFTFTNIPAKSYQFQVTGPTGYDGASITFEVLANQSLMIAPITLNSVASSVTSAVYFSSNTSATVTGSTYGASAAGNSAVNPYHIPSGATYLIVQFADTITTDATTTVVFDSSITAAVYTVQQGVYLPIRANSVLSKGHTYKVDISGLKVSGNQASTVTVYVYQD